VPEHVGERGGSWGEHRKELGSVAAHDAREDAVREAVVVAREAVQWMFGGGV
jgi:hypothetical protein